MSMTSEEAIKRLEEIQFNTHTFEDEKAMEIAIRAVRPVSREQVEQMRGEWIVKHNEYKEITITECSKCGEAMAYEFFFEEGSNFCPHCGAPMTDDGVDIVMERLEALKDGM